MIRREASRHIWYMARVHPVVTVAGPRHSGKTTLIRTMFPRHGYVNLDTPDTLEFARRDPAGFLKRHPNGLVIDEYRRAPELFSHIRAATERVKRPGQFILITSRLPVKFGIARPPVKYAATQILLPLTIKELSAARINLERNEYIYRGFLPQIYSDKTDPKIIHQNYRSSYLNSDIRQLIKFDEGEQDKFELFMKILAERVGQIINPGVIIADLEITYTTFMEWMSALEAGFIIFRLPSLSNAFVKNITKIPKFYFTDIGMAAHLLGIESAEQIFRDPMVGNLFENMMVAEALKYRYNLGLSADLYYFRNKNCIEIDLIVDRRHSIMPIEIKFGAQFDSSYAKNLILFHKLSRKARLGYVVYSGETKEKKGMPTYINFKNIQELMKW